MKLKSNCCNTLMKFYNPLEETVQKLNYFNPVKPQGITSEKKCKYKRESSKNNSFLNPNESMEKPCNYITNM
jgi:hypothetical protein